MNNDLSTRWRVAYTDHVRKALNAFPADDRKTVEDGMHRLASGDPHGLGNPTPGAPDRHTIRFGLTSVAFWITDTGKILTVTSAELGARPLARDVEEHDPEQIVFAVKPISPTEQPVSSAVG